MLSPEEFNFIENNLQEDPRSLALKAHGKFKDSMGFLLDQISIRKKLSKKLPSWVQESTVLFPSTRSSEQCSSEITAHYKASLVEGKSVVDITGGMGVDAWAFSKKFDSVKHIEYDPEVQRYAKHNFSALGINNIESLCDDGLNFLKSNDEKFDLIFADPDRRPQEKRTFELEDNLPNVVEHQALLLQQANNVLVKASPMCGIKHTLSVLNNVKEVHVVGYKNECKEVLFLLEKEYQGDVKIVAVELGTAFKHQFWYSNLSKPKIQHHPLDFIYDPFVAYRKANLTAELSYLFPSYPIGLENSLLTSSDFYEGFPGRVFKVIDQVNYDKASFKKTGIKQANVIARGLPVRADEIVKKLKLKDGGNTFLIAYKNQNNKLMLLLCERKIV